MMADSEKADVLVIDEARLRGIDAEDKRMQPSLPQMPE